jgi:hypothetical protein
MNLNYTTTLTSQADQPNSSQDVRQVRYDATHELVHKPPRDARRNETFAALVHLVYIRDLGSTI